MSALNCKGNETKASLVNTVADRHRFEASPDPDPDLAPAPTPSYAHGKKIRLKPVLPFKGCAYLSFNKCPI
jgi:hypothetical protein